MNATTKTTLDLAKTLAKSGFHIPAIEIHTPDGRTWNIATVPAGRGRHLDGHWGPRPGALGGFRLFEIDRDTDTPNEHDAIDGERGARRHPVLVRLAQDQRPQSAHLRMEQADGVAFRIVRTE